MLTGIQVEVEGEKITLAVTDRFRFAVRMVPAGPGRSGAGGGPSIANPINPPRNMGGGGNMRERTCRSGHIVVGYDFAQAGGRRPPPRRWSTTALSTA